MADPITVDIPHKLGQAGARGRIEQGVGQLAQLIPGSAITERHWEGDTLAFSLEGMGQRIAARLDVLEDKVHATIDLPPMLALFAAKIRAKLLEDGTRLLR
jgi:hypothetical protein